MAYLWLKGPREAAALTQEALAAALQINNVKTIQRLERCGLDTPRQVNYTGLATVLGVSSIQLAEDHARDLTTARLMDHARRAREAADRLRRAKHFQAIDPVPIQSALATCWATGLIERIADRHPNLAGEQAQAERIAQLLSDGQLDRYTNLIDIPLEETIEQSATVEQLDTLERCLRVIIRACSAKDQGLQPGHWYLHHGESKAWPFRALIDHSCGLDGMRWVRTAPNTR